MKTIYFECNMGAAGDMISASLFELIPEEKKDSVFQNLKNIGLDGVSVDYHSVTKCGIEGTHFDVLINGHEEFSEDIINDEHHHHNHEDEHHHEHHHEEEHHHHAHHNHSHHSLEDIQHTISHLNVSDKIKNDIFNIYKLIAEAESHAHGKPVEQIHFHEVGEKDAIMDVAAACYLINEIAPEQILASPINTGSGQVKCAHGIMPVPTPATEFILRSIPTYQGIIKGELCTPTGAAILKYFAKDFCSQPLMKIENVGIGCGTKDFPAANCIRAFLGDVISSSNDTIISLEANIDDMTPEEIGFATEQLFEKGAREVFTTSVYMKKNRPGTMITVICTEQTKQQIIETFFKYTTTIGIRQKECQRYILDREIVTEETCFGNIRKKISTGYGTTHSKLEYDDLSKIAKENGISLQELKNKLQDK